MSPLAKLLQIKPAVERPHEDWRASMGKIWKRFVEILRSAKVQRRVRRLEVVERVAMGNKQSVVLLRVDQREFVVGCCGESVVLLVAPQPELVAAPAKAPVKRRRAKAKVAKTPVFTAPQVSAQVQTEIVTAKPAGKAKPAEQVELALKTRVPSKSRLVKSFAGRTR